MHRPEEQVWISFSVQHLMLCVDFGFISTGITGRPAVAGFDLSDILVADEKVD